MCGDLPGVELPLERVDMLEDPNVAALATWYAYRCSSASAKWLRTFGSTKKLHGMGTHVGTTVPTLSKTSFA